ncbi:MAG: hypothetical protein JXB17_06385, partial [Bacteroidales bacterium]|nr:hypothetical protein [Bacteroidales bacterium]
MAIQWLELKIFTINDNELTINDLILNLFRHYQTVHRFPPSLRFGGQRPPSLRFGGQRLFSAHFTLFPVSLFSSRAV